jgi:hypothetical protein
MFAQAEKMLLDAYTVSEQAPVIEPLIFARVTKDGVEKIG